MNHYKFRAECSADVARFFSRFAPSKYNIAGSVLGDVVVEFFSGLDLATLKVIARQVVDGHVIVETLAFKEDYTGERGGAE